jgi:hypothetical protein
MDAAPGHHSAEAAVTRADAYAASEGKAMTDAEQSWLWTRRYELLYRVQVSVNYHRKFERALSRTDRSIKFVGLVGGSAAVTKLASSETAIVIIGALIALTSAFGLVAAIGDRARLHAELATRFKQLESDIVRGGERDFKEVDLDRWEARQLEIEAEEPPEHSALIRICQNEIAIARGDLTKVYKVSWFERRFAYIFDFPASELVRQFPDAKDSAGVSGA